MKTGPLLLTMALLGAAAVSVPAGADDKPADKPAAKSAEEQFQEAVAREDFPTINRLGAELLKKKPDDLLLLSILSVSSAGALDWPHANDYIARCLKIEPKNALCLSARRKVSHENRRYDAEIADLTTLLEMGDERAALLRSRANAYRLKHDLVRAAADYNTVLKDSPDDARALSGLAYVEFDKGNTAQAIATVQNLIKKHPAEAASAQYDLACMFALKKDAPGAAKYLKAAFDAGYIHFDHVRLDPDLDGIRGSKEYKELASKYKF
jgi:tetratricopeptide (TPR) repeat protein